MRALEITTYISCPNNCWYCPQGKLIERYEGKSQMTMSDLDQILQNTPKDVRIDFTGFSEVFCHPEGAKMILLAYSRGFNVVVYTTLVGFKAEDVNILRGVKFSEVVFHRYPGYDEHKFAASKSLFVLNIQKGRDAVIDDSNIWSRAGNAFDSENKMGPLHCLFAGKDYDHNVVLPNGDVYLCCQDYSLEQRLGNLYTQNFNDLDREKIRLLSYTDEILYICRNCELAQHD